MEENTINIDVATGEITHSYTEPIPEQPIVINYDEEVVRLIRLRYSQDEENAIQRKYLFDKSNEVEFLEYYNYVEQCKAEVRQLIENHS